MIKQVIVIRKDLAIRRGKEISSGAHAAIAWIIERIKIREYQDLHISDVEEKWMNTGQTKITLQVSSEEELLNIYNKAKESGLETHLITDAGLTEFHGVPTKTALAIGPDKSELIDKITGNLKLY